LSTQKSPINVKVCDPGELAKKILLIRQRQGNSGPKSAQLNFNGAVSQHLSRHLQDAGIKVVYGKPGQSSNESMGVIVSDAQTTPPLPEFGVDEEEVRRQLTVVGGRLFNICFSNETFHFNGGK